jgi:hypothetical protein
VVVKKKRNFCSLHKTKKEMEENVPFSSCGQPAPAALLAKLVPPGTVFRQEGTGIEFTVKKVRKWGRYDTLRRMTKQWMGIVNKIHVDNGVPVVDWRKGSLPFYAFSRTMDEEAEHILKMLRQTVEAARKHLVGRYFRKTDEFASERICYVGEVDGRVMAWIDRWCTPVVNVVFVYPSLVPKLVSPELSLKDHTRLTGKRDGVATWSRDYRREETFAICMRRLGLVPDITRLILQFYWTE